MVAAHGPALRMSAHLVQARRRLAMQDPLSIDVDSSLSTFQPLLTLCTLYDYAQ